MIEMAGSRAVAILCAIGVAIAMAAMPPASATAAPAPALSWTAPAPADASGHPTFVSCPLEALCVGVDDSGNVLVSGDPTAPAPAWTSAQVDPGRALSAVSCAGGSLCVAVDGNGDALSSSAPRAGSTAWSMEPIDGGIALTGVSCPTASLCVAVDAAGRALVSLEPARDVWGPAADIDGGERLTAVSCSSASSCVATDAAGAVLASGDPAGGASAWRRRQIDPSLGLNAVSCSSGGACVAVDGDGNALSSGDPTSASPTWSTTEIDLAGALAAVSCGPLGQCVAVDSGGAALASEAPVGGEPAWGFAGVDSQALTAVSCAAGSFCLALDATGRSLSAPVPASASMVAPPPPTPRPAILGTPALGSQLRCGTGLAVAVQAQLSFQWLRELEPIASANTAAYTVIAADEGHHLQCRVTVSNPAGSATATSAFVTIPFQGLPVASGETSVGRARANGSSVRVPVACSPKAPHGCKLLLRLTRAGGHGRAVTVAARRARLARGARATVTIGLRASDRRLLARRRRLAVSLLVGGTVIGSIEAALSEQRLVLSSAASRAIAVGRLLRLDAAAPGVTARASAHGLLAATPYMGWDSYFAFGARYSESTVLEQASDLLTSGLARRGYRLVWLDVGWWQGSRSPNGRIELDRAQWPHGLAWLASTLHHAGLRLGLYTDAGADGCGGLGQGSYGHYQQDADTFAAWGVDAVKVDFCGGSRLHLDPARAYREYRLALNSTPSRRPMLLSICDFLQPGEHAEGDPAVAQSAFTSYAFGPRVGNSWRTDGDVGVPGRVPFGNVLRNLDADAAHPEAAGPGHWNDPDYLGPDQGMGVQQFRTQMSMWAMLAAPLMVSRDLGRISAASLATIENRDAIAIDQDPLGAQGTLVSSSGAAQVWVKPLSDGSRAVALLNRGPTLARIATSASAVGLPPSRRYAVRNVWAQATRASTGALEATVGHDATVLLRVSTRG